MAFKLDTTHGTRKKTTLIPSWFKLNQAGILEIRLMKKHALLRKSGSDTQQRLWCKQGFLFGIQAVNQAPWGYTHIIKRQRRILFHLADYLTA